MKFSSPAVLLTQLLYAQSVLAGVVTQSQAAPPRRPWPLVAGPGSALLPLVDMGWHLPHPAAASATSFRPVSDTAADLSGLCDSIDEGTLKYFSLQEQLLKTGAPGNRSQQESAAYRRRFKVLYREGSFARARATAALGEDTMAEDDPVENPADEDLHRFEQRAGTIDTFFARIREARDYLLRQARHAGSAANQTAPRAYALQLIDTQIDRARSPLSSGAMPAPIFFPDLPHLEGKLRGFIERHGTSQVERQQRAKLNQAIGDINRFYADGTRNIMGPHQREGFPNVAELDLLATDGVVTFTGPKALENALKYGLRAHRSNSTDNRSTRWKYAPQDLVNRDTRNRIPVKGLRFESMDIRQHLMRPFARYFQLEMHGDQYRVDKGPWIRNPFPENDTLEKAKYLRIRELMTTAARRVLVIQQTDAAHDPRDLTGSGWFLDFLRRNGFTRTLGNG